MTGSLFRTSQVRASRSLLLVFLALVSGGVAPAAAPGRPCGEGDWRYVFGPCSPEGVRNVYTYTAGAEDATEGFAACDRGHPSSRLPPPPLLDSRCDIRCVAGSRLAAGFATGPGGAWKLETRCEVCDAGRFSLGGGVMVDGSTGDWRRPWPVELMSSCAWQDRYGYWRTSTSGGGSSSSGGGASACSFTVASPSAVAGAYDAATAPWQAAKGLGLGNTDVLSSGVLLEAPDDGLSCSPFSLAAAARGAILLVQEGGCGVRQKARTAEAAGAGGVLLVAASYDGRLAATAVAGEKGASGPLPTIQLLAVGREDGDVLTAALRRPLRIVVGAVSEACSAAASRQATNPGGTTPANGSTASSEGEQCAPWTVEGAGQYVHSGDNRAFNNVMSSLTWTVNLVSDGYIAFRYAVDAEARYDGLTFSVDWNTVLTLQSQQLEYTEHVVNLSAGAHILEWTYSKDGRNSHGSDRARISLVELLGTAHSDLTCRRCRGAGSHSIAGSAHCNACDADSYLEVGGAAELNLTKCSACPAGRWSPPGSIGVSSCVARKPCGPADLETTYTPCRANSRFKRVWWRKPIVCDPDLPGSDIQLVTDHVAVPCEPCQPNEHRPSGASCEPKRVDCAPGLRAVQELYLSRWFHWPRNVTREVWAVDQDMSEADDPDVDKPDEDHPNGHGWRLHSSGRFAFAGDDGVGAAEVTPSNSSASPAEQRPSASHTGGLRYGDALLNLRVNITVPDAELNFHVVLYPEASAWGSEAFVLINGTQPRSAEVIPSYGGSKLHVRVPLQFGLQRITWVWQYRDSHSASAAGTAAPASARGMRLVEARVTHAAGAGSSKCERCPQGHEVSSNGLSCRRCAPGTYLPPAPGGAEDELAANAAAAAARRCAACPAGTFSANAGSTACLPCGPGTRSTRGSAACSLVNELVVNAGDGSGSSGGDFLNKATPMRFDLTSVRAAWDAATIVLRFDARASRGGPFEVEDRLFHLALFEPAPAGAASAGSSSGGGGGEFAVAAGPALHIAELRPHEAGPQLGVCDSADGDGSTVLTTAPSISAARAIDHEDHRGLLLSFGNGGNASGCDAEKATFFFRCDPAAAERPPARRDALGVYHLPGLVLRDDLEAAYGLHGESVNDRCASALHLEWPTASACPPCRLEDYRGTAGECDGNGMRVVSYVRMRPCRQGEPLPPSTRESCPIGENGALVTAAWAVLAAVLLSCLLCCYACHLHRKYGRFEDL
eukprot:TRINITY_DN3058_c1_g3_i1.p1 TRINITY_DN3058_c1_g3~~TRINITY_DN3058_c1_g3_i1.p1  ORF type:complete len:1264 (+),score=211.00 TRINITY_DN3058_c1_g3_i1:97-3792(+)